MTEGLRFTAAIRAYLSIGPRTRAIRNKEDVRGRILEIVETNVWYDGYFSAEQSAAFRPAFIPVAAWRKHVEGYRADPATVAKLSAMPPFQFTAFLGHMIDAGISNVGEAEKFLAEYVV